MNGKGGCFVKGMSQQGSVLKLSFAIALRSCPHGIHTLRSWWMTGHGRRRRRRELNIEWCGGSESCFRGLSFVPSSAWRMRALRKSTPASTHVRVLFLP